MQEEKTKNLIKIFQLVKKEPLKVSTLKEHAMYQLSTRHNVTISSQYHPIIIKTVFTDHTMEEATSTKQCIAFNIAERMFKESIEFENVDDITAVEQGIRDLLSSKK